MGDRNPKSQAKAKKQDALHKSQAQAEHDRKHAPAPPATKGKGK